MEKIEVFFCAVPADEIRKIHRQCCYNRWQAEPGVHVRWLWPKLLKVEPKEFQRLRRVEADRLAQNEIYILADDDCLLTSHILDALQLAQQYQSFAMLSLWPANAEIHPWRPEGREVFEDAEVQEHVSVGGIRICRKGAVRKWPEQDGPGYDREHCEAIRESGMRAGYLKNCPMLHLGEGTSTVWL